MASKDINSHATSSEETGQSASSNLHEESTKDANSAKPQAQVKRTSNLQKIRQRKQQTYNLPQEKKLLKLANYSACQAEECKCTGWKNAQPIIKSAKGEILQPVINFFDPCKMCTHPLENHIKHLPVQSDEEINRLLGMAIDVDIIYAQIHGEVDPYTKKAYFYLYELLRNCLLSMTKPTVGGPLEQPPFERPNIAKAVTNFVLYKISRLPWREWQIIYDMARVFLCCLNFLNFEGLNSRRLIFNADEAPAYKTNYTRWLVFCHVPAFCDSLPHYDIRLIFGKTLLQAVFRSLCRKLMDICNNERDKLATERGVLISTHLPKFLSSLEVEIYSDNSPIWDPEFKQIPPFQTALESKAQQDIHPGLTCFKDGVKSIPVESIPGIRETGSELIDCTDMSESLSNTVNSVLNIREESQPGHFWNQ